jgi:hypothetical protein
MKGAIKEIRSKVFTKKSFESLQLNKSRVVVDTFFYFCDFTKIDINSLAFFRCRFNQCIFNRYPEYATSTYSHDCIYVHDIDPKEYKRVISALSNQINDREEERNK